jgi:hypothetical protein
MRLDHAQEDPRHGSHPVGLTFQEVARAPGHRNHPMSHRPRREDAIAQSPLVPGDHGAGKVRVRSPVFARWHKGHDPLQPHGFLGRDPAPFSRRTIGSAAARHRRIPFAGIMDGTPPSAYSFCMMTVRMRQGGLLHPHSRGRADNSDLVRQTEDRQPHWAGTYRDSPCTRRLTPDRRGSGRLRGRAQSGSRRSA